MPPATACRRKALARTAHHLAVPLTCERSRIFKRALSQRLRLCQFLPCRVIGAYPVLDLVRTLLHLISPRAGARTGFTPGASRLANFK